VNRQPEYPKQLMEKFGGRRFVEIDPPGFHDYSGTELI